MGASRTMFHAIDNDLGAGRTSGESDAGTLRRRAVNAGPRGTPAALIAPVAARRAGDARKCGPMHTEHAGEVRAGDSLSQLLWRAARGGIDTLCLGGVRPRAARMAYRLRGRAG